MISFIDFAFFASAVFVAGPGGACLKHRCHLVKAVATKRPSLPPVVDCNGNSSRPRDIPLLGPRRLLLQRHSLHKLLYAGDSSIPTKNNGSRHCPSQGSYIHDELVLIDHLLLCVLQLMNTFCMKSFRNAVEGLVGYTTITR